MPALPHDQVPTAAIAGFDICPELISLSGHGGDQMTLIVSEGEASPHLGIHNPASWARQWSIKSQDDANGLLALARREGTARAILSTTEPGGAPNFWDVALSRRRGQI